MSTLHERLLAATEQPLAGLQYTTGFLKAKVDALRAVVELHAPTDIGGGLATCEECDGRCPPCSTIKIIAAQLGVEIGETP